MIKVVAYFYPDMNDASGLITSETTLEEYFEELRNLCEQYEKKLHRSHVLVYAKEGGKLIFSITGATNKLYSLAEEYKEYDSMVWNICKKYFRDAKEKNKIRITSAEDLRNIDVIIKGYTIPQDYDYGPDYYTRCKMTEAFEKISEIVDTCPDMFYNLQFDLWTWDEEYLFCIRRDLYTIHLGRHNKFDLTKGMIREAVGIKIESRLPKEILTKKVIAVIQTDASEPVIGFEKTFSLDECFDFVREYCEKEHYTSKKYLDRTEISVCTEERRPMFKICGNIPSYCTEDGFDYLEPIVFDIYSKFFIK